MKYAEISNDVVTIKHHSTSGIIEIIIRIEPEFEDKSRTLSLDYYEFDKLTNAVIKANS